MRTRIRERTNGYAQDEYRKKMSERRGKDTARDWVVAAPGRRGTRMTKRHGGPAFVGLAEGGVGFAATGGWETTSQFQIGGLDGLRASRNGC